VSPGRRLLLQAVALVVVIVSAFAVLSLFLGRAQLPPLIRADQAVQGPVLLVPGYGGATGALEVLAGQLRQAGRAAMVLPLPGDGTGDLALSVAALDAAAAASAVAVDLVGYSAGGVVARTWAKDHPSQVRRVVTLGSPHHGTQVAAIGAALAPGACPVACQQLVPGSRLLDALNDDDETPDGPQWLSLWTTQDETVTPPTSARLDGAVNVELQALCPSLQVSHSDLPRNPVVARLVVSALAGPAVAEPGTEIC